MLLICVIDKCWGDELGVEKCFVSTGQRLKSHVFLQGQQLMDLEHKLTVAKEELEKTALDKVKQWGKITND